MLIVKNGHVTRITHLTAFCLCLASCGGSSTPPETVVDVPTSTPSTPEVPDPNTVVSFQTDEYNSNWGLDAVNAAEAYALGYTGEGVLVAAIDFNFDFTADDVDYHSASLGRDPDMVDIYEAQIGDTASTIPHGHAVAATIAALKDDVGIHGVAFDAEVIGVDFFSGVYTSTVTSGGIRYLISDPWQYAYEQGARIFNKSLGYDEEDIISNPPSVSQRYILEYDTRVVELGGLLVSSAGNGSDPEPSLSNLDALDRLTSQGLLYGGPGAMIIVGAVDENLELTSFSDAAGTGESKFHYMVAPGENIVFPWTEGLVVGGGTSFSAPYVTGAAAIIMSRWPSLTAREVADILFESATDLGEAGIDSIYGHGLLDIEAALQPIGSAKLAVPSGKLLPVETAAINFGPAFGDIAKLRTQLEATTILDSYNRDFQIDANHLVRSQSAVSNLENRMTNSQNWRSSGFRINNTASLNYALSKDRDSIPAFALAGQAESDFAHEIEAAFEFAGSLEKTNWIMGTGRSLTSAVARDTFEHSIGQTFSLTGVHDADLPIGDGLYMAFSRPVGDKATYWFGASRSEETINRFHPVEDMRAQRTTTAFIARYDQYNGTTHYGIEVGAMLEDGSLLGSSSTGGIALGSKAQTVWTGLQATWTNEGGWGFSAKGKVAYTGTDAASNSLIEKLGSIVSSSFALQVQRDAFLQPNDMVTISLHQPLRVENATAIIAVGQSFDAENDEMLFSTIPISLTPSGREVAFEAAYSMAINGWQLQANAAYRHDAGHFNGLSDTLLGLTIRSSF